MRTEPGEGAPRSRVGTTVGIVLLFLLLAGGAVVWMLWWVETSRTRRMLTQSSLDTLRSAIRLYRQKHGRDPETLAPLEMPPGFLVDSWDRPIQYEVVDGRAVRVWSTGPDEDSPDDDFVVPIR